MWVYWILFLWPALAAIAFDETRPSAARREWPMWSLAILLTLVIGLRFEVGVDWGNYLNNQDAMLDKTWLEVLLVSEPAYNGLNWLSAHAGIGIWLSNLVCAIAFASGLFSFCRRLPNPWLALTIAMPFMAIVMAMNYTRQGAAFGLMLWALIYLHDGRLTRFVAFIVLACLFHKSAAVVMPLGALITMRNRTWVFIWIGIASLTAYWLFIADQQEVLYEVYLAEQMASDGAWIRVIMNAIPAVLFLVMKNRVPMIAAERNFWTWMSVAALLFIPALVISPSSTAVDRVALYFMPIQLIGFTHLSARDADVGTRNITTSLVIVAYAVVQYVWFNYSNYYWAWLPYRFYPFEFS